MNIFVVIVTYNAKPWAQKCLNSLLNSTIPLNIIVIDNGSQDETRQYIKQNFKDVFLVESHTNLGFGKANNIGIKHAIENNADYIYLLNQDAWVDKNTIELLVKLMEKNPQYGILSPMQLSASREKLDLNFANICNNQFCPGFISDLYVNSLKEIYDIASVMAAHWLISLQCIEKVGGFAPIFPHYGEDDNYIHRAKYHGFKIGICPFIEGVHDREMRANSKEKEMYLLFPLYLSQICNINNNFILSFIKAQIIILKQGIKKMVKYKSISFFKYYFYSIIFIPKILITRKRTKKAGNTYL